MDLNTLVLLVLGLAAGVISALFGVGGGLIVVPALHYLFGVDFRVATVLSLAAICLQSPFGVYQHAQRGAVSWRLGGWMAVGGAVGVAAGLWLQQRLSVAGLKLTMAVLMLFGAWRMVSAPPQPRVEARSGAAVAAIGVVAGTASRLLGIGGGLLTVPLLALDGVPMHTAVGSSLVPVFTNSLLAAAVATAGGADVRPALWIGAGALAGSPLGVRLAHRLPAKQLKRAFAAGLTLAALYIGATSGAF